MIISFRVIQHSTFSDEVSDDRNSCQKELKYFLYTEPLVAVVGNEHDMQLPNIYFKTLLGVVCDCLFTCCRNASLSLSISRLVIYYYYALSRAQKENINLLKDQLQLVRKLQYRPHYTALLSSQGVRRLRTSQLTAFKIEKRTLFRRVQYLYMTWHIVHLHVSYHMHMYKGYVG